MSTFTQVRKQCAEATAKRGCSLPPKWTTDTSFSNFSKFYWVWRARVAAFRCDSSPPAKKTTAFDDPFKRVALILSLACGKCALSVQSASQPGRWSIVMKHAATCRHTKHPEQRLTIT